MVDSPTSAVSTVCLDHSHECDQAIIFPSSFAKVFAAMCAGTVDTADDGLSPTLTPMVVTKRSCFLQVLQTLYYSQSHWRKCKFAFRWGRLRGESQELCVSASLAPTRVTKRSYSLQVLQRFYYSHYHHGDSQSIRTAADKAAVFRPVRLGGSDSHCHQVSLAET